MGYATSRVKRCNSTMIRRIVREQENLIWNGISRQACANVQHPSAKTAVDLNWPPGHAGVQRNKRAVTFRAKQPSPVACVSADLKCYGLFISLSKAYSPANRTGTPEVLRSLRHYLRTQHKAKDITLIDRLEERGVEKDSGRRNL